MTCAACGCVCVEVRCSAAGCGRVFYRCDPHSPKSCSRGKPFDGRCPHCRAKPPLKLEGRSA